jgi:hypothetical protein
MSSSVSPQEPDVGVEPTALPLPWARSTNELNGQCMGEVGPGCSPAVTTLVKICLQTIDL